MNFKIFIIAIILSLAVYADKNATITCKDASGGTFTEQFTCYQNNWGIEASSLTWAAAGAPKSKLAAGLAFYSRVFGNTQDDQLSSGLFDTCSWCYSLPSVPAVVQYFAIKSQLVDKQQKMAGYDWSICRDDVQQSPWAFTNQTCGSSGCDNTGNPTGAYPVNFFSYDDAESIKAKTEWAIDNGLGSLIVWELYGDDCASTLLNTVHQTKQQKSSDIKVTAYYGNWRIYGAYKYYPYIPKGAEGSHTCSDAWDISKPVTAPRDWGVTSDIASKIDILNIGFATVAYDSSNDQFFTVSPDPNADYQSTGLPSGQGAVDMLQNPLCLTPYIGAYESGECSKTVENSQCYVTYSGCSSSQGTKKGLTTTAETYSTSNKKMAGVYNAANYMKKENPNVKTGISVGGWYDSNYFSAAADEKYRLTFAKGAARYADAFGFDNLDIDWEYPTNEHCNEDVPTKAISAYGLSSEKRTPPACQDNNLGSAGYSVLNADNIADCFKTDAQCQYPRRVYDPVNLVLFLRDVKKELISLDPKHGLTMALRADPKWIKERMPAKMMAEYLDQFNDMTYDYNAAYNRYAALNAPLESCANPQQWESMQDIDCVTSGWGALDASGNFKAGATSECMGLCDGDNYNQHSTQGLQMQYRTISTYPKKNGVECGELYKISSCSGTCSLTDPKFPDHWKEWKTSSTETGKFVQDWGVQPCGCKNITNPWSGQVTYGTKDECCDKICGTNAATCKTAEIYI